MNNILDRIKIEVEANAKIINSGIPRGLSIGDRFNSIKNSLEASKTQLRNELLLTRKLELEALLEEVADDLGYKVAK